MSMPPQQPPDDLETRLDAAFEASRPRPGFDRELWTRIEATPKPLSLRRRLPALWGGRVGMNFAPALAALVVVALGGTALFLSRGPVGGGNNQSSHSAGSAAPLRAGSDGGGSGSAAGSQAAVPPRAAEVPARFGKLPKPELNSLNAEPAIDSGALPYYDAAEITWSGRLPSLPSMLPVYRYGEPLKPELDAFAARLRASPNPVGSAYSAPDLNLAIFPSTLVNGREPLFALTPKYGAQATPPNAPSDEVARMAADGFLSAHKLIPDWDSVTAVQSAKRLSVVRYAREFAIPGSGFGIQIDSSGKQVGLDVVVRGDGAVFQVSGPVPLQLAGAEYPAKPPAAALQAALAQSAPGQPKVTLTRATLVYEALADGDHGYFVPALLFTGLFEQGDQSYEKRLLVQILDPSSLR